MCTTWWFNIILWTNFPYQVNICIISFFNHFCQWEHFITTLLENFCDPVDYRVLYPCNLLLYPCNFPGKNTGVGWHFLLQRSFPTQGSNARLLHLLHWRVDSLPLSCLGSPSTTQYSVINFSYHVVIRSSDHIYFETEIFYPFTKFYFPTPKPYNLYHAAFIFCLAYFT